MDTLIEIGQVAPEFQLMDLAGRQYSLAESNGLIKVLYFWSAECDWCQRVDHEIVRVLAHWKGRVKLFWIASNANESPGLIETLAKARDLPIVLLDAQQQAADKYGVQTTPHIFVLDGGGKVRYHGSWDDVTFRQKSAMQVYIPQVIQALEDGCEPEITRTPPYGCALVRFGNLAG